MNSYQLKQTARSRRNNAQNVQRLYSILKHPKIKLKIGEKVVQTIRIKKIFIVAMMLMTTKLLVIMRVVMIMMTWMIFLVTRKGQTDHPSITEVMRVTMNIVPYLIVQRNRCPPNQLVVGVTSGISDTC